MSTDDRNISWMYLEYVGMTRGFEEKTNTLLKALVGKVDGLSLKDTSASFKGYTGGHDLLIQHLGRRRVFC